MGAWYPKPLLRYLLVLVYLLIKHAAPIVEHQRASCARVVEDVAEELLEHWRHWSRFSNTFLTARALAMAPLRLVARTWDNLARAAAASANYTVTRKATVDCDNV